MSDLYSLIITSLVTYLSYLLARGAFSNLNVTKPATIITIFIIPVFTYLAVSGKILGFKAFGIQANLRAASKTSVSGILKSKISPKLIAADTENLARQALFEVKAAAFVAAKENPLNQENNLVRLRNYALFIYNSLLAGQFEVLIVLDDNKRVLGYFPKETFLDLLRIELVKYNETLDLDRVFRDLRQTELSIIFQYPRQRAEIAGNKTLLLEDDTNLKALKLLTDNSLSSGVVVDRQGKYVGVVIRKDLVAKLSLSVFNSISE